MTNSLVKKAELNRCDRFIDACGTYRGQFKSIVDIKDHFDDYLEEQWEPAINCSYCVKYWSHETGCDTCPLSTIFIPLRLRDIENVCCQGLWAEITKSCSKEELINNFKNYRNYVKEHG